jgi:adenylylsulfate reductase subunit A
MQKIADDYKDDPKAYKKKKKELESEAWEDFLDMTISQAHLWAATNVQPEEKPSEIAAAEPYCIGSHSGASGAWVSGPADLTETCPDYFWGYPNMTTVKGLFASGDASGASSHKFSSGSHAEGRIAAKGAIDYILDNNNAPTVDDSQINALMERILKPLDIFNEHKDFSTDPNVNPNYIRPHDYMVRLQKLMDEYAGGVSMQFTTNKHLLERGMELMTFLEEDSDKLAAENLNELTRVWENIQRTWQAKAHIKTIYEREETRWPGYYYRADFTEMNENDWKAFVNVSYNRESGEWEMTKRPIHQIVE